MCLRSQEVEMMQLVRWVIYQAKRTKIWFTEWRLIQIQAEILLIQIHLLF